MKNLPIMSQAQAHSESYGVCLWLSKSLVQVVSLSQPLCCQSCSKNMKKEIMLWHSCGYG